MKTATIRAAVIGSAVLAATLFAVVGLETRHWVGRVFPGFFVLPNRVVPSIALPDWLDIDSARLFQNQIVAVNDVPARSAQDIYAFAAAQAPGTPIRYTVQRGDGAQAIETVTARRFSGADYSMLFGAYFLTGGVFMLIGLLVLWLRPQQPASLGLFSAGAATAVFAITGADLYGPAAFIRLHVIAESVIAASFVHLALVFPVDRIRKHRLRALLALYLPFLGLAAVYELLLDRPDAYRAIHLAASVMHGAALVVVIGLMLFALGSTRAPLVRRRIGVVALGTLTAFLLPAALMGASGLLGGSVPVNGASLTGFLFPICIAYAIVKQDLFEIDIMLRRAITYAALAAIVATACVLVLFGLRLAMPDRVGLITSPIVLVALNFAMLAVAALLRHQVQRAVDRVLFPKRYDGETALAELSHRLAAVHTAAGVTCQVEQVLSDTVAPTLMTMLETVDAGGYAVLGEPSRPVTIPAPLAARLTAGEALARYEWDDGSGRLLPPIWHELGADLLVPIQSREAMLGVLVLASKASGRPYTAYDLAFVRAASDQLALALTNARAFERLAQDAEISAALLSVQRAIVF